MDKIIVTVCSGTTCYVLGGAELFLLEENLPEEFRDYVKIKGSSCLGFCNDVEKNYGSPPFVTVNQTVISGATTYKVIQEIERELQNVLHK